jgi:hypothetical protein
MSINLVSILFLKVDTIGYQPWSWYVFMTIEKLQTLNNAPQWTNKDKKVQDNFGQIDIYLIYTHPQCGANEDSWGHCNSSQIGQVFLESIDHNWFFAKTT